MSAKPPDDNFNPPPADEPLLEWVLGELAARPAAQLERNLAGNPALAKRADEYRRTMEHLNEWLEDAPQIPARLEAMPIPTLKNARPMAARTTAIRRRTGNTAPRHWMILAAALLLILPPMAAWIFSWRPGGGGVRPPDAAMITAMQAGEPVWLSLGGKVTPPGEEITTTEGIRQLARLAEEVDAALDTRTRARVLDSKSISLTEGSIWLWVRPGGAGYTVHTPVGKVQTLGTQFGVTIREGKIIVEVVQGRVRVADPDGGEGIVETGRFMEAAGKVAGADPRKSGLRLPDWVQNTVIASTKSMRHLNLPSAND